MATAMYAEEDFPTRPKKQIMAKQMRTQRGVGSVEGLGSASYG